MTIEEHKTAWIQASYETLGWCDKRTIAITEEEAIHILETQESLCQLGRNIGDDGSCAICRSVKKKLLGANP